jgi:hypothetical protein
MSRVKETRRKYKVGQNVRFRSNHMTALAGTQDCKIVRPCRPEDGPYRSASSALPRVAHRDGRARRQ